MITSIGKFQLILMVVACLAIIAQAKKDHHKEKPAWAKKKLTDYSDADMERLLDQWNVRGIFRGFCCCCLSDTLSV